MTREEAAACWEVLTQKNGDPDPRGWGEQFIELTRILRKGTPVEKAQRLQRLYRVKAPLPETHQMMVARYEDQFFGDLAKALKKSAGSMKSVLHREQPAFAGEAPFRAKEKVPPKPESLKAWSEGDGFHVYGSGIVMGESTTSGGDNKVGAGDACSTLFRPALNGAWLLLHRPQTQTEDGETYEGTLWVAVHVEHADKVDALLAGATELGDVYVEGGTSAAVDAEVRDDPWFRRDFEAGETKGRGFIISLGGDGVCTWKGAFSGDQLCLVAADGMWE